MTIVKNFAERLSSFDWTQIGVDRENTHLI